ncbi:hypothetical protein LZ32DRAFT_364784 [Colletotrichum eremochloae]|nr:hypothetical protein LZ32DRAFT_364784 [Colletotrichum eremochloae]
MLVRRAVPPVLGVIARRLACQNNICYQPTHQPTAPIGGRTESLGFVMYHDHTCIHKTAVRLRRVCVCVDQDTGMMMAVFRCRCGIRPGL